MRTRSDHPHGRSSIAPSGIAAAIAVVLLALPVPAARALPVSGSLGYEYFDGSGDQLTRGIAGTATIALPSGPDVTLAGARYIDSFAGQGLSFTGGLGLPLAPEVRLRGQASRLVGDGSFRAWRFKAGPQLALPGGASLLVSYQRYEDNGGVVSNGAALESATPIHPWLSGRLNASFASLPGDLESVAGSAGLGWTPVPSLELSGEIGLARNGSSTMVESSPALELPIVGHGSSSQRQTVNQVSPTALVGLRWLFP